MNSAAVLTIAYWLLLDDELCFLRMWFLLGAAAGLHSLGSGLCLACHGKSSLLLLLLRSIFKFGLCYDGLGLQEALGLKVARLLTKAANWIQLSSSSSPFYL